LFLLKTAERHDSADRLPVETPFACISVSENQMSDPYDLQQFIAAQKPVYDKVCFELRDGSKKTHWMWFIFRRSRGWGSVLWPANLPFRLWRKPPPSI